MDETYDVVLLVERELTELDARQVVALHEGLDEPVSYHLLIPVEDAASKVQAALGSIARYELIPPMDATDAEALQRLNQDLVQQARAELDASVELLRATGRPADGRVTPDDPVRALAGEVDKHQAAEAIVLTAPHAVQEFFHLDWTSRARRVIGIPTLHLLEHETLDEQGGAGEGVSGV
ncbi:MAG: hypothetical protein H0V32_00535 [Nocardioidaceae bacterium]|nr:hypothetical protein [Nocardioidaceae bacterium]MDQ3325901.1 hypothetical protein [Actinomycetota bacterium]